jgi:hypothetical protein
VAMLTGEMVRKRNTQEAIVELIDRVLLHGRI